MNWNTKALTDRLENKAVSQLISLLGLELFTSYVQQCAKEMNVNYETAITKVALNYTLNLASEFGRV